MAEGMERTDGEMSDIWRKYLEANGYVYDRKFGCWEKREISNGFTAIDIKFPSWGAVFGAIDSGDEQPEPTTDEYAPVVVHSIDEVFPAPKPESEADRNERMWKALKASASGG
jgi:hypothetical protein